MHVDTRTIIMLNFSKCDFDESAGAVDAIEKFLCTRWKEKICIDNIRLCEFLWALMNHAATSTCKMYLQIHKVSNFDTDDYNFMHS